MVVSRPQSKQYQIQAPDLVQVGSSIRSARFLLPHLGQAASLGRSSAATAGRQSVPSAKIIARNRLRTRLAAVFFTLIPPRHTDVCLSQSSWQSLLGLILHL